MRYIGSNDLSIPTNSKAFSESASLHDHVSDWDKADDDILVDFDEDRAIAPFIRAQQAATAEVV